MGLLLLRSFSQTESLLQLGWLAHAALLAGTILTTIQTVRRRHLGHQFTQVIVTTRSLAFFYFLLLFHFFDHFYLFLIGLGMDLSVQPRLLAEFIVALDE